MTWYSHGQGEGKWNIDHIIPIKYPGAAGGEPTLEEVAARLHYTNTQPMWASDNIAKGNRFIGRTDQVQEPAEVAKTSLTDDELDVLLTGFGF